MNIFFNHGGCFHNETGRVGPVLWLAMAILLLSTDAFSGGISITLPKEIQVTGKRIVLGEVGAISGGEATLMDKIASIDLGPAPQPGRERHLSGRMVTSALKSAGLKNGLHMSIPDKIVVKGAFQTLSESSLADAFKAYVARKSDGDEVAVSRIRVRGSNTLPLGKLSLRSLGEGEKPIKGKVALRFMVSVDGKEYGQVSVSGWVDRYARAVCTTRFIPSGKVVTDDDICLKRINLSKASAQTLLDPALAIGKRLRSGVGAGEVLGERMLTAPPLIEKGDQVKILARGGIVSVSTLGTAMSDGLKGEQIKVENTASEKTVIGRVVDESTVEVLF